MIKKWYDTAKQCTSLRKNTLRVDLCLWIDDIENFTNENTMQSTVKSILTSAVIKGLDIIGIVNSSGPHIGIIAQNMAKAQQMDITVVAGQSYMTSDKQELFIYNLKKPIPQGLTTADACVLAHKSRGFVMARNVGKRKAQVLNKLVGSASAPDAIEIFNAKAGSYQDVDIDFPRFVSSGALSANDLEEMNIFTLLDRKDAVEMGFLAPEEGVDYTPKYLKGV